MANELPPPLSDKYLKALSKMLETQSKMIETHFKEVENRLVLQNSKIESMRTDFRERTAEVKDNLRKSDEAFDRKFDKLEVKVDELASANIGHLVSLARVETEGKLVAKNRGTLIGLIAGSLASIIVTIITKVIGF